MKKILDLSTLIPNTIVRLIPTDGKCYDNPECFCIVKSVTKIPKKDLVAQFTYERQKKVLAKNKYEYTYLKLVEFNAVSSPWNMTMPTKGLDSFISISDTDYEFTLFSSSLDEVKTMLAEAEAIEIAEIHKSVKKQKEAAKQNYRNILTNTLEKLIVS